METIKVNKEVEYHVIDAEDIVNILPIINDIVGRINTTIDDIKEYNNDKLSCNYKFAVADITKYIKAYLTLIKLGFVNSVKLNSKCSDVYNEIISNDKNLLI